MPGSTRKKKKQGVRSGKLRIADHWNAISIIANSQANPLKAVAEFVENSIDARAKKIVIVRGKKKGDFYLKISDDGEAWRPWRDEAASWLDTWGVGLAPLEATATAAVATT